VQSELLSPLHTPAGGDSQGRSGGAAGKLARDDFAFVDTRLHIDLVRGELALATSLIGCTKDRHFRTLQRHLRFAAVAL
jgi:hypothetical protein